jgi:hypothetical protein
MVAIFVRGRFLRPTWLTPVAWLYTWAFSLFVTGKGGGEGGRGNGGRRDEEGGVGGNSRLGNFLQPTQSTLTQYKDRRKKRRLKESVTTEWPMLQAERRDGTAWTLRWRESVPETRRCARTYAVPSSVRLGGGRCRFGLRLRWWRLDGIFGPLHPQVRNIWLKPCS